MKQFKSNGVDDDDDDEEGYSDDQEFQDVSKGKQGNIDDDQLSAEVGSGVVDLRNGNDDDLVDGQDDDAEVDDDYDDFEVVDNS